MAAPSALEGAFTKVKTHGLKYSAVSVVNVVVGTTLLYVFTNRAHIGPTISNFLAVSISAVPAYYMNRAWVWGKRGRSSLRREVLPFWGFAVAGLVLSLITVTVAAAAVDFEPGITGWRRFVPNMANLGAFGVLWVVKFFVLDAVVFRVTHADADELDGDLVA